MRTDPHVPNQTEHRSCLQRGKQLCNLLRESIPVGSFESLTPVDCCPEELSSEPLAKMVFFQSHGNTEAVVLLAWVMRSNIIAVTTTTKPERLSEHT